jgi:endonuclease/exonuclease/phosphatase family metal-dependent hydrolase
VEGGAAAAAAVRRRAAERTAEGAKRTAESARRTVERARRFGAERSAERARRRAAAQEASYLCLVRAPRVPMTPVEQDVPSEITVATYNVHRWIGRGGRRNADPGQAEFVLSELGADVIALQEVLRPEGDSILEELADRLGLHVAFAVARRHKKGELGNAILSRWPIQSASTLDISHSRIERRSAVAARFSGDMGRFAVIATHLSLVDRTRKLQVRSLMEHPELAVNGPAILMGDMNAWRNCKATRVLDDELRKHDNPKWPASFPATKPMLALDRIYARGAHVHKVWSHDSEAARTASDHLPVIAKVVLPDAEDWEQV